MTWQEYEDEFIRKAREKNLSLNYIQYNLEYARALFQKGLPVIFETTHLSLLVGYSDEYILGVTTNTPSYYRYFSIPKKKYGFRNIAEPLPNLKNIQWWLLENLLYKCETHKSSKAFKVNSSIKDNARYHVGKKSVLNIDIENYFTSIKGEQVSVFFKNLGYNEEVTEILTSICTLNNSLPQGAPTSPYLSNLVTSELDSDLLTLARENDISYSRYADDITFSGDFNATKLIGQVKVILSKYRFRVNDKKIRKKSAHQKQLVTGLVVNKKIRVEKRKRNKLRQCVYYIKKFGLTSHMEFVGINKIRYLEHLIGIANHIVYVNPKDTIAWGYLNFLRDYREKFNKLHNV